MKAFIIAGGEGTRLRPYTYSMPKPMMALGGKPILAYVIENLRRSGFDDIVITVGYRHEQIMDFFGDGTKFGVKISYSVEKEKLNTAGSIIQYKGKLKEPFAVVMGDHLTNIDLKDMLAYHKKNGGIATIALFKSTSHLEYGVAKIEGSALAGFSEKPLLEHLYNTAIYIFEPEIFEYIKQKEDFAKDVIPRLIKDKKKVSAYVFQDVWFDIGRVSDYERFFELFNVIKLLKDLDRK